MTTVKDIQEAIARLSAREVRRVHEWLDEFDAQTWDAQFQQDAQGGRLDGLGAKAIEELRRGRCRPL